MRSVEFKSLNMFFVKEKSGIKNNTVRLINNNDVRFKILREFSYSQFDLQIRISNADNPSQFFTRLVRDVSFFDDFVIITWYHVENSNLENNLKDIDANIKKIFVGEDNGFL